MPFTTRLKLFYFIHFAKPQSDRPVYRAIHRQRVRKIVELGVGGGQRAMRMIRVASLLTPVRNVHYAGIDWFEGRSEMDGPGMTLKAAYSLLRSTEARVQLVPGDPVEALIQNANALGQVDLLIFSLPGLDPAQLGRAWYYVPRLLHEQTQVYVERILPDGGTALEMMAHGDINAFAANAMRRRAA